MPDFDIPGLGRARQALTALAKSPRSTHGLTAIKKSITKALYTEIRAARLAGYSWASINKAICDSGLQPRLSEKLLAELFREVDKEYERETGVKALLKDNPCGDRRKMHDKG